MKLYAGVLLGCLAACAGKTSETIDGDPIPGTPACDVASSGTFTGPLPCVLCSDKKWHCLSTPYSQCPAAVTSASKAFCGDIDGGSCVSCTNGSGFFMQCTGLAVVADSVSCAQ